MRQYANQYRQLESFSIYISFSSDRLQELLTDLLQWDQRTVRWLISRTVVILDQSVRRRTARHTTNLRNRADVVAGQLSSAFLTSLG